MNEALKTLEADDERSAQWLRGALGLAAGQNAFPWQLDLLRNFLRGDKIRALDIPTGLGKTATMAVWLVARALGAPLPRRLVYVVDRRAVVDRATEVAVGLREWVAGETLAAERLGLRDRSLPISTLRGQFVDNREWLEDPSAPAIVVGTVDMVGSRLLFSGYGVSTKMRPYHADEGRYHGAGDDLPSPFRLFQALVAGAGISGPLDGSTRRALAWLGGLPHAPIIAAPRTVRGQSVSMFMPNNDLDAKGGDVRRMAEIRLARKVWRPRLFDPDVPWVYAWPFANGDETPAAAVCALSEKLYQFGRGVDMAWAWGELLDEPMLEAQLTGYDGMVRRPSAGDGLLLACPDVGSLESLERRYRADRFRFEGGRRVFVQSPRPSYRQLAYESLPARHVFELRPTTDSERDSERPVAWPLAGASSLVVAARDSARARLADAMPNRTDEIDRHLVGRKADGSNAVPAERRVRVVPIRSIGMRYADRGIRRLLVEIPAACSLRSDDVRWGFSGAELFGPETGGLRDLVLVTTDDDRMLRHYGVGTSARVFRTVTPVVVPEVAKRRRIEPTRRVAEAKRGMERVVEIAGARAGVLQALRHVDVRAPVEAIRAQREPFDAAGIRVEPFAAGTRFAKERLWHVEIAFGVPVAGPLLIGDGRFLGLGLMAPVPLQATPPTTEMTRSLDTRGGGTP